MNDFMKMIMSMGVGGGGAFPQFNPNGGMMPMMQKQMIPFKMPHMSMPFQMQPQFNNNNSGMIFGIEDDDTQTKKGMKTKKTGKAAPS